MAENYCKRCQGYGMLSVDRNGKERPSTASPKMGVQPHHRPCPACEGTGRERKPRPAEVEA